MSMQGRLNGFHGVSVSQHENKVSRAVSLAASLASVRVFVVSVFNDAVSYDVIGSYAR